MRRILIALLASSVAALVVPAAASAHHHRHHGVAHRARAHRHHRHAHMVVIAPAAKPAVETPPTTEPVATVASFEEGVLKITLPDGTIVSGNVTEATWIGCGCSHDFHGGAPGFQHDGPSPWQQDAGNGQGDFQHGDDEIGPPAPQQSGECGVSSLVPGAKVKEAELSVSGAGAFWEKVELYPQS